jgi:hypothetical protein
MSSTHVHQPGIHRTRSTGPAPTPAPLPGRTTSVSFPSQPLEVDNIPFSRLVTSTLVPAPRNPIPEHASPQRFDVQRELTPGEQNLSPERQVSGHAPELQSRTSADPLQHIFQSHTPRPRPDNQSTFQPPYPSSIPRLTSATGHRVRSVFARLHLSPTPPRHTPNPFTDVHYAPHPGQSAVSPAPSTGHTTPIQAELRARMPASPYSPHTTLRSHPSSPHSQSPLGSHHSIPRDQPRADTPRGLPLQAPLGE